MRCVFVLACIHVFSLCASEEVAGEWESLEDDGKTCVVLKVATKHGC